MRVVIKKVEWIAPEIREGTVTFSVDGFSYQAFSCGPDYIVGATIEAEFSHLPGHTEWSERFGSNVERKKQISPTGNWSYNAFGQISSIGPVIADFGIFQLDLGDWTHDERVLGEHIFWRIGRLEIYPKERA